uniref:Uncharacterized protein n=1 Tax=Anguilla anguilla TaxID=7936 RepID=A0A0E9U5J0_ANGAN
MHVVVGDTGGV